MPNPTTPAVDVAEGRRLWENAKAALAAEKAYEISNVQCYETVALYQAWAFDNAEALLTAASERDAAVREVEAMKRLLAELADNLETTTQDSFLRGGGWQGSEDCLGIERARAALASAAQGGANG